MKMNNTVKILTIINICTFAVIAYLHHVKMVERYSFLIKTYDAESSIQSAQMVDLLSTREDQRSLAYQEGFEEGRTQAAVGLMNGGALYDYATGYHAAFAQMGDISMPMPPVLSTALDKEEALLLEELEKDIETLKGELKE